jgi:heat shock protein HslJ
MTVYNVFMKTGQFFCVISVMAVFLVSCGTAGNGQTSPESSGTGTDQARAEASGTGDFSAATGRLWRLVSVTPAFSGRPAFNRNAVSEQDAFTLTFSQEESRLSGKGHPNRYFGPYTVNSSGGISLGQNIVSTRMASLSEPASLREHEYFVYLQNTISWRLENRRLILTSKQENGTPATLVFEAD